MDELTLKRKGIPPAGQLVFLFCWLALIAVISSVGSTDAPDENMKSMMQPGVLRVAFVMQSAIVFLLPVIFNVFLLRRDRFSFFTLGKAMHPLWLISSIFAIFFILPAVGWLGEVNATLNLPEVFSDLEKWMKAKEIQTAYATEVLLNDKTAAGLAGNLFTMAFMAAFTEEIFFRATLQRTLSETRMNPHLAVWITAFVFSAIHLQFFGFLPRFILGAVLGYLFFFTGNVWVSIIAHFLNNSLVVILAFFSAKEIQMNPLEKNSPEFDLQFEWHFIALSFVLTLGVFLVLHRMKKNSASQSLIERE